jgi:hypothetical protein
MSWFIFIPEMGISISILEILLKIGTMHTKKYYEIMDDEPHLSGSSSCDHFIMDGAKFDSAYLHIVDDKAILKYLDRTDPKWYLSDICEEGIEYFVPEGTTPTWEELKEMCK